MSGEFAALRTARHLRGNHALAAVSSGIERWWREVISGQRHSMGDRCAWVALTLAERMYGQRMRQRRERLLRNPLRWPVAGCRVISVGNLTLGGTGKTPTVQWVSEVLRRAQHRHAVVCRGYGGARRSGVVSDGMNLHMSVQEAGDEALVHARALPGVPVLIGHDRRRAAAEARHAFGVDCVVLDDGYQYWSLPRNLDVLVIDAMDPFGNGHLFPAGILREEQEAISRAQAILLTKADRVNQGPLSLLKDQVRSLASGGAVMGEGHTVSTHLRRLRTDSFVSWEEARREQWYLACGVADPVGVERVVRCRGLAVVGAVYFSDHHRYVQSDLQRLTRKAKDLGATGVLTTEKDAVKWEELQLSLPTLVIQARMEVDVGREALERSVLDAAGGDWGDRKEKP